MNSDFRELLRIFQKHSVRYLVVGGYAVMRYTEPRYTKDLDIWIDIAPGNASRVYSALAEFGAPMQEVNVSDFANPGQFFQIGVAPVRIDVISTLKGGMTFADAWAKKLTDRIGTTQIHFISKADLIRSKRATKRLQDRQDIAALTITPHKGRRP